MSKYYCNTCNFNTRYKNSYDKHLQSNKHIKLVNSTKEPLTTETNNGENITIEISDNTENNNNNIKENIEELRNQILKQQIDIQNFKKIILLLVNLSNKIEKYNNYNEELKDINTELKIKLEKYNKKQNEIIEICEKMFGPLSPLNLTNSI